MTTRTLSAPILALFGGLLALGCAEETVNPDHARCRTAWMKQYNIIFEENVTPGEIRWFHDCMERQGYRRVYDAGRCRSLAASVREAACFAREGDREGDGEGAGDPRELRP